MFLDSEKCLGFGFWEVNVLDSEKCFHWCLFSPISHGLTSTFNFPRVRKGSRMEKFDWTLFNKNRNLFSLEDTFRAIETPVALK